MLLFNVDKKAYLLYHTFTFYYFNNSIWILLHLSCHIFYNKCSKTLFREEVYGIQKAAKCIHGPEKGQELLVLSLKTVILVNKSLLSAEQSYSEKNVTYSKGSRNRWEMKGNGWLQVEMK